MARLEDDLEMIIHELRMIMDSLNRVFWLALLTSLMAAAMCFAATFGFV